MVCLLCTGKRRLDIFMELKNEIGSAVNINRKLMLAESKKKVNKNVHTLIVREQTDTHDFL